jgi:hypothetical protein
VQSCGSTGATAKKMPITKVSVAAPGPDHMGGLRAPALLGAVRPRAFMSPTEGGARPPMYSRESLLGARHARPASARRAGATPVDIRFSDCRPVSTWLNIIGQCRIAQDASRTAGGVPPSHGGAAARKSSHRFGSTCTSTSAQQQQELGNKELGGMTCRWKLLNPVVLAAPVLRLSRSQSRHDARQRCGRASPRVGGILKFFAPSPADRRGSRPLQRVLFGPSTLL